MRVRNPPTQHPIDRLPSNRFVPKNTDTVKTMSSKPGADVRLWQSSLLFQLWVVVGDDALNIVASKNDHIQNKITETI